MPRVLSCVLSPLLVLLCVHGSPEAGTIVTPNFHMCGEIFFPPLLSLFPTALISSVCFLVSDLQ